MNMVNMECRKVVFAAGCVVGLSLQAGPGHAQDDLSPSQSNECTKTIVFAYESAESKFQLDSNLQEIPAQCQAIFASGAPLNEFEKEGCDEIQKQNNSRGLSNLQVNGLVGAMTTQNGHVVSAFPLGSSGDKSVDNYTVMRISGCTYLGQLANGTFKLPVSLPTTW